MSLKYLIFLFLSFNLFAVSKYAGELSIEGRYFPEKGQFSENKDLFEGTLTLRPEASYSWDNDRKVFSFVPYARVSTPDDEKNSLDIRELSFVAAWGNWELRAGVSKVFWGVAESYHLVDVINQTDLVSNIDGEDKLGQPMINPSYISPDYGNFSLFVLPYFRERTFPGKKGRFRTSLSVDTDAAAFENKDKEAHIDFAFQWTHYYESFDWGINYFKGTDREPLFQVKDDFSGLIPFYIQAEQTGLTLQYIYESWIFKFEGLLKENTSSNSYTSAVGGLEYTVSNIGAGGDIGVLFELLYDNRGQSGTTTGIYNHSFIATRFVFNDADSTQILAGIFVENKEATLSSLRIEASTRLNEYFKTEFEANFILAPDQNNLFYTFKDDDYIQAQLSFYW